MLQRYSLTFSTDKKQNDIDYSCQMHSCQQLCLQ